MTMDKHLLHSTDHDASEDAPSTAEENSHESSYHSANGERARREASTESEHSTSSVTKSESCWAAEPTSSVSAATPSPGAILLLDDLFIAQTLHKISPLNFSDPWLSSVRAKYLASFLTTSSTTRAAETKTELLTLVAFNPDSNAHLAANIAIRDRTLYLSNICEILAAIGQYQRHREQQLRGDSGTEKGSGHSSAGNSSSSADVDLLLKDIRSYILTTSTASTGGESAKATATEINTTTGQTPSGGSDDLQHVHQNGDSSGSLSGASRRRHSSSCSSPLLGSILVRLTKLLHGCIESDATRYDFYQIFANAIHSSTLAGSSDSYRNLNNLVNSLANFDLNSSQIMLGANAAGPGASSVKPQANTSSTATAGGSEREHTPPSSSSSSSMARKDSLFASSGTTHFYQSVADCCEELSTSGGSSSSSGYGRSTTSNCSGIGGGTAAPPLFRDILLAKPANPAAVSSSSTSPGTIGSGASAASTREPHSSGDSLGSPLSSTFLNSQLAAVAAELCDLNDLPKLIPPTETAQPDLYGSPFDMRLPAFTGRAQHGILERPEAPLNFFTINAVSPPNASSNQCFTISMDPESAKSKFDSNHGAASLLDKRTAVEVASACLSDSYSQPNGTIPPASLIERDLFYRLIISQLLYHGHRSIANQLASAERIKADGSLLSPSDRLHILVSMAFRSEINKISVNPTPEMTPYSRPAASSAPYQLMDPSPNEQTASGLAGRSMLEDGTGYSKNLYERSQSHLGHSTYSSLFNSANGHGKVTADEMTDAVDYGDVPIDHLPDVGVYRASPELYFASNGPSRSSTMGSTGSGGLLKQMSHPPSHLDTSSLSNRSQSNNSLRSGPMEIGTPGSTPVKSPPSLASTMLDLNAPSGSGGNGGVGFVLNENAMKNLNQLASKLNDVANVTANGAAAAVGPGPIFGRSASAMASMNSGSSSIATSVASVMAVHQMVAHGTTSAAYHGQLSRSPVPGALNGTKSPLGLAAANGPSHTTGNGKNHKIMQIRSKFGSLGAQTNQFSSPHGFCLGINEEIVIADTNNHRICVYEKNGTFKHSFGNAGKDEGQLWYPRKITMICSANVRGTLQNPYYVICDRGMERSRMQIFTRAGNFVRKIPIRYIDIVAGIAVNAYGQIVTVDSVSPTIFIISETGDLVEWFDCSDHMREPSDIAIYKKEYYICDFKGHCVVVFNERGKCLRKIGIENLTSFPNGIDISANGDILVGDSHGNRFHVAIFNQEGKLLTEYECPYVKVSRCCGLKLTSEGYVVTLAKNNHHVLVLNTLFIGP